jgi:DNA-directed RNA polymerase subunit A'
MAFKLPKLISALQFGLLSPDEIRKMSVVRVITADTYDEDGTAIPSGLMDDRLGTINPGQRCKTCGNRVGECEGHFGHIELARPIAHVGFNKKIYKILRGICRDCSRILLTEEEIYKFTQEITRYEKRWEQKKCNSH